MRILTALIAIAFLGPAGFGASTAASILAPDDDPSLYVVLAQETENDLDCEDFQTQEEAQATLDADPNDLNNLDPNGDGIACGLLPSASDLEGDVTAQQAANDEGGSQRAERRRNRNRNSVSEEAAAASCQDFQTQEEAQAAFDGDPEGLAALDEDGNGVACEELIQEVPSENADRQERKQNRQNQQEESAGTIDEPVPEDLDCVDFEFQEEAQAVFDQDPSDPFNLDPNGDGFACSSLPSQAPQVSQVPNTGVGSSPLVATSALVAAAIIAAVGAGASLHRRRH